MDTDTTTSGPSKQSSVFHILKSESFIEKVFLLALTAILSGVIIPLIIKSVDSARQERETLSRAQAKLFDDVSETILTYETLILDVSWFGTEKAKNVDMQKKAFGRYQERSVDLIARWRVLQSRAQTLASRPLAPKLNEFLNKVFSEQDTPINTMWIKCGSKCDWEKQHLKNQHMLVEANVLIAELANDLGLAKKRKAGPE